MLSPETLFRPFGFERASGVVAAVSGGGDSLALMFLLRDFLATLPDAPPFLAVTVDHRLRPESAAEAEAVAALCREAGVAHRILVWDEAKPASGFAAAARSARYRLLGEAAREAGADVIATGHTEDDQIETFLMRKARSGHDEARGLAAMAARSRLEGRLMLVRPLLDVSRAALRAELTRRGVGWIDDPSNENPAFERPRLRMGAAAKIDRAQALAQIALAAAARRRDNAALAAALGDPASLHMDAAGRLVVDARIYAALPQSVRRLFAGLLAALAGGRRFLPGEAERSRVDRMLCGEDGERLTVFGALIERGAEAHVFRRERRNLARLALAPGATGVWDGRFRFTNGTAEMLEIAAPARGDLAGIEMDGRMREALLTAPALYRAGGFAGLACMGAPAGLRVERHFALFDHVLPGYDFALAEAVERRLGRACPNFHKPE